MKPEHVMILGVGNILFSDEGFGIHAVERINERFTFDENVSVVDGGVLGMNLLGTITEANRLFVIDAMMNRGAPGSIYRFDEEDLPKRIREKNSLHQVDLLEALTLCRALDNVPKTVVFGVEPSDIESMGIELTKTLQPQLDPVIDMVMDELTALNVPYYKRSTPYVSGSAFKNCSN